MNIWAKLKSLQRDVEALKARVDAFEPASDPWPGAVPMEALPEVLADVDSYTTIIGGAEVTLTRPLSLKTIKVDEPIASATLAPAPRKRGRPPKPKS